LFQYLGISSQSKARTFIYGALQKFYVIKQVSFLTRLSRRAPPHLLSMLEKLFFFVTDNPRKKLKVFVQNIGVSHLVSFPLPLSLSLSLSHSLSLSLTHSFTLSLSHSLTHSISHSLVTLSLSLSLSLSLHHFLLLSFFPSPALSKISPKRSLSISISISHILFSFFLSLSLFLSLFLTSIYLFFPDFSFHLSSALSLPTKKPMLNSFCHLQTFWARLSLLSEQYKNIDETL
jgi:hypothetical protein